jgi:hypothetical protein
MTRFSSKQFEELLKSDVLITIGSPKNKKNFQKNYPSLTQHTHQNDLSSKFGLKITKKRVSLIFIHLKPFIGKRFGIVLLSQNGK